MLTKTDFTNYLECPMYLWLSKNRPELLPDDDAEKERIMAAGREVDEYAKKLFPTALEIKGYNETGWQNTQRALVESPQVLFQPTAVFGDLAARADILVAGKEPNFNDEGVKFLYAPAFLNIHDINEKHKHVGLTYFAKAKSDKFIHNKEEYDDIRWFSKEDLEKPEFNISETVKFYAKEALKRAS